MPLYLFDLARGETESLSGEPSKQRRAQSVAYHPAADQLFVAYTFSDSLACVGHSQSKNHVRYVSAIELGLSYIRGVCALGESDLLAVSGEFRGITLIDAKTLAVVRRIDVPLYDSPHLTYLG